MESGPGPACGPCGDKPPRRRRSRASARPNRSPETEATQTPGAIGSSSTCSRQGEESHNESDISENKLTSLHIHLPSVLWKTLWNVLKDKKKSMLCTLLQLHAPYLLYLRDVWFYCSLLLL